MKSVRRHARVLRLPWLLKVRQLRLQVVAPALVQAPEVDRRQALLLRVAEVAVVAVVRVVAAAEAVEMRNVVSLSAVREGIRRSSRASQRSTCRPANSRACSRVALPETEQPWRLQATWFSGAISLETFARSTPTTERFSGKPFCPAAFKTARLLMRSTESSTLPC